MENNFFENIIAFVEVYPFASIFILMFILGISVSVIMIILEWLFNNKNKI